MIENGESAARLESLGRRIIEYANANRDRLPDTLDDLKRMLSPADMEWLRGNVEYMGKGRTVASPLGTVVAYDKMVLREGRGTPVLYVDFHVIFESPARLELLGIKMKP